MNSNDSIKKLRYIEWSLHILFFSVLLAVLYVSQTIWLANLREDRVRVGKEIAEVRRKLDDADEIADQHKALVELKEAIEKRAADITDRIPDHPSEGEFLKQTTTAARESGLTIKEYLRRGIEQHDDHSRLTIHLSLQGTFKSICEFVDRLERLPRISKVSKLRLSNRTQDGLYPMELTLILFFRVESPDARVARARQ